MSIQKIQVCTYLLTRKERNCLNRLANVGEKDDDQPTFDSAYEHIPYMSLPLGSYQESLLGGNILILIDEYKKSRVVYDLSS